MEVESDGPLGRETPEGSSHSLPQAPFSGRRFLENISRSRGGFQFSFPL